MLKRECKIEDQLAKLLIRKYCRAMLRGSGRVVQGDRALDNDTKAMPLINRQVSNVKD
jgi:hypothetical protein